MWNILGMHHLEHWDFVHFVSQEYTSAVLFFYYSSVIGFTMNAASQNDDAQFLAFCSFWNDLMRICKIKCWREGPEMA